MVFRLHPSARAVLNGTFIIARACGTLRGEMTGLVMLALLAAELPNAVVLRPVANMYSKPSEDADVVSQAIYGANVTLMEEREGWAHIRTADDYTGWTPLSMLRAGPAY